MPVTFYGGWKHGNMFFDDMPHTKLSSTMARHDGGWKRARSKPERAQVMQRCAAWVWALSIVAELLIVGQITAQGADLFAAPVDLLLLLELLEQVLILFVIFRRRLILMRRFCNSAFS